MSIAKKRSNQLDKIDEHVERFNDSMEWTVLWFVITGVILASCVALYFLGLLLANLLNWMGV